MSTYWILAVALLVCLNAFFVAAEYTVVASRARHIDALRRAGHRIQRVEVIAGPTENTNT